MKLNGSGKVYRDTAVGQSVSLIYGVPWANTSFADLSIVGTPPGSAYGVGDNARIGMVFWQDTNNWIGPRLYVADDQENAAEIEIQYQYNGGSVTVLRRVNFGTEINHGVSSTLSMVFDGNAFVCYLGTEPVFTWKLSWQHPGHTPWSINYVGITSDSGDAGSTWDNFIAKSNIAGAGMEDTAGAYLQDTAGNYIYDTSGT
jgi:hypothetical protein